MPQNIPLRLGPLGGSTPVSRSGIRWLRRNGQMCRPGDVIGVCNIAVLGQDGWGENPHFLGERDDLRVALLSRVAGRLRHAPGVSLGGWIDERYFTFRWQAGQAIGSIEVQADAPLQDSETALTLYCLAGRRVSDLAGDRSGLLTGWHDRKRAWHADGAGQRGSLLGLGICELSPVLRGTGGAFLDLLQGLPGPAQVLDVSDTPLVHCARVLIEQSRRAEEDAAVLAEDFTGMMASCLKANSPEGCIFAAALVKALNRSPLFERYGLLTSAGVETSAPAEAVILSLNAEAPVLYRHRKLGYTLHCHGYRFGRLGEAMAWIRESFEQVPHTIDDVRRDYLELARLVRESGPDRQILVLNSISTLGREDILSYDAYDPPLGQLLTSVRARELNAMLHDIAGETGIAIVDSDALAAELGVGRCVPDGIHQSEELQDAIRQEILQILRERDVPGFGAWRMASQPAS